MSKRENLAESLAGQGYYEILANGDIGMHIIERIIPRVKGETYARIETVIGYAIDDSECEAFYWGGSFPFKQDMFFLPRASPEEIKKAKKGRLRLRDLEKSEVLVVDRPNSKIAFVSQEK